MIQKGNDKNLTPQQKTVLRRALFEGESFLTESCKKYDIGRVYGTNVSADISNPDKRGNVLLKIHLSVATEWGLRKVKKGSTGIEKSFSGNLVVLPDGNFWTFPEISHLSNIKNSIEICDLCDYELPMFYVSNGWGQEGLFIFSEERGVERCFLREKDGEKVDIFSHTTFLNGEIFLKIPNPVLKKFINDTFETKEICYDFSLYRNEFMKK